MTLLSTLCRNSRACNNIIQKISSSKIFLAKEQNAFKQAVRNMSGGSSERLFYITPSRFQYTKLKDDFHFYVSIGVIPLGLLILYVNIFIGPATLTEIPEDYEPKHWEYYKHPIKRFIAKHFHVDPQIEYEKILHVLDEEHQSHLWRAKIDKVKELMLVRDDYKGIYFIPSDQGKHYRKSREFVEYLDTYRGFK